MIMLFASPLVTPVSNAKEGAQFKDIDLLDYTKEFDGAKIGLEQTNCDIELKIFNATVENFSKNIKGGLPVGMHFTGHGEKKSKSKDVKEDSLIWEKQDASAHWIDKKSL